MPNTDFDPSASWPAGARPVPSHSDFMRLEERLGARIERHQARNEEKLDNIQTAILQMVALQTEMAHSARRIEHLEKRADDQEERERVQDKRMDEAERKVEKWINMGRGAWVVAAIVAAAGWTLLTRMVG